MMNLLSALDKKQIREEYSWRFVETASIVGIVVVLLGLVLLLPSFIYVTFGARAAEAALLVAKSERTVLEKDTETRSVIKDVQARLALLAEPALRPDLHPLITAVLLRRTGGITIDAFSFDTAASEEGPRGTLVLGGTALDRAKMLAFVASLEADPLFSRVDSPLVNLVPKKDIPFVVTLHVR